MEHDWDRFLQLDSSPQENERRRCEHASMPNYNEYGAYTPAHKAFIEEPSSENAHAWLLDEIVLGNYLSYEVENILKHARSQEASHLAYLLMENRLEEEESRRPDLDDDNQYVSFSWT